MNDDLGVTETKSLLLVHTTKPIAHAVGKCTLLFPTVRKRKLETHGIHIHGVNKLFDCPTARKRASQVSSASIANRERATGPR